MDDAQISRLESSFTAIVPQSNDLVKRFYQRLFLDFPSVRPLFPTDTTEQEGKLFAALSLIVSSLRALDELVPMLQDLGRRHLSYGTIPPHYAAVRDTLITSMGELAADAWTDQLTQDWQAAIDLVAQTMLSGANTPDE